MVECRVSLRDGRTITKSISLDDGEALESLSKGLSVLKKEVNSVLSEEVDRERLLLAKGGLKRPSSTEEDDDGEVIGTLYVKSSVKE